MGGKDEDGNVLTSLFLEEQKSVAKIALLAAEGIVSGGITSRNEDHLKYLLDQLTPHTLQQAFGVTKQGAPVEILINLDIDKDGTFFVDTTAAREEASKASPSNSHFNLIMDIPDGSGRKLRAHLEDVPIGKTVVDVDNLPAWLRFFDLRDSGDGKIPKSCSSNSVSERTPVNWRALRISATSMVRLNCITVAPGARYQANDQGR